MSTLRSAVSDSAPSQECDWAEMLKRCTPATIAAAGDYRSTGNRRQIPTVVFGIIQRFVEPDLRPKLDHPQDSLRLVDDLAIDSLTMMEIVLLAEEVFEITINNDDLHGLNTLGDVQRFITQKVGSDRFESTGRDPLVTKTAHV